MKHEVLHTAKDDTIKRRKPNWIGHPLRGNCLLKHVTEGKIKITECDGKMRRKT